MIIELSLRTVNFYSLEVGGGGGEGILGGGRIHGFQGERRGYQSSYKFKEGGGGGGS